MPQSTVRGCSVDGCESQHHARGMCRFHYKRLMAYGDPLGGLRLRSLEQRFLSHVEKCEDGCWLWCGQKRTDGYGLFQPTRHKPVRAHRWSYEHFVGPIPSGLVLDHLCRNPACVSPQHLEPVAQRVNVLRGISPPAQKSRSSRCPNGHEYTPDNTNYRPNGTRQCRECMRSANRVRQEQRYGIANDSSKSSVLRQSLVRQLAKVGITVNACDLLVHNDAYPNRHWDGGRWGSNEALYDGCPVRLISPDTMTKCSRRGVAIRSDDPHQIEVIAKELTDDTHH